MKVEDSTLAWKLPHWQPLFTCPSYVASHSAYLVGMRCFPQTDSHG